jgi:membrane-associated phospholipid phosphatase
MAARWMPLLAAFVMSILGSVVWAQQQSVLPDAPSAAAGGASDAPLGQTGNVNLPPDSGASAKNTPKRGARGLLGEFAVDQKQIWTSPARIRLADATWLVPMSGIAAGLFVTDRQYSASLSQNPSTISHYKTLSNAGIAGLVGAGAGMYLFSFPAHNDHWRETGFLTGEAALNSLVVVEAMKYTFGRERPYQGNGSGNFFSSGTSFPSEHAAAAWSIAGVIAHEYPGIVPSLLAYGTAAAVDFSRVHARQHFPSDVFVGSVMGYLIAQNIYGRRHDPELSGRAWEAPGEFMQEELSTSPSYMGSPYVQLDSWVYPAFERLIAMGYVSTAYLGIRPWTRLQCARFLEEAGAKLGDGDGMGAGDQGTRIYQELSREFAPDMQRLEGGRNIGASLESVYTRLAGVSGPPLRDGYHFGSTLVNDFGRPFGEGVNSITGGTAEAVAGSFSFQLQAEYQHAPSVQPYSSSALRAMSNADFTALFGPNFFPPGYSVYTGSFDRFRLLQANVGMTFSNIELSYGKQSTWLGPGEGGPLLLSDNAEAIPAFSIRNVFPFRIPLLSKLLGSVSGDYFVGRLAGQKYVVVTPDNRVPAGSIITAQNGLELIVLTSKTQPYVHGGKLSFKPTANLEFGMGITYVFGGPGFPVTWSRFFHTMSPSSGVVNGPDSPGDRRSAFDFAYRIPHLRDWLTAYVDSMTEDEISPLGSTRPAVSPGLYFPRIPKLPGLSLRLEGMYTNAPNLTHPINGFVYWNSRYIDSYTNDGNLLASWVGRQGEGEQGCLNYYFSPRTSLNFSVRHQEVDKVFIGGGSLTDFRGGADVMLGHSVSLSGFVQYEDWHFPVLAATSKSNITTSVQVTFWPKLGVRK